MNKTLLQQYNNGNSEISIYNDGTRVIKFDEKLELEYPLNIDIRVQSACPLGYNPKTNKAICSFCHESATTNGKECDYEKLKSILKNLPKGIEIAIGYNHYSEELTRFLYWCKQKEFICNITINQLTLPSIKQEISHLIKFDVIKGLGISLRNINKQLLFLDYSNTVVHVIAGIDNFDDVVELSNKDVKKILILGEKDFGFNKGNVDLTSKSHLKWLRNVHKLFKLFDVVSFDNLATEQLKIKRFFKDCDWQQFYQYEHSFYINAVDEYFSPSSRSNIKTNIDEIDIKNYFKTIEEYKLK